MHVCYVANSRFPSERAHMTQIVQMCNAFAANGHTVTLLVTDRKTDIREDPESYYGVPFKFAVARVRVPDIAGLSSRIPVILRSPAFFIQRLVFLLRAGQYVNRRTYDILYGRDEWILWALTFLTRAKVVWESHEAKFSFAARNLLKATERVVVISEGIRDFYISHGIPKEKILVAHDAVDERFFAMQISMHEARKALGIDASMPIVMYIGGLEEWKGVGTLLEASKDQEEFKTYIIGGKGSEISRMREKYPFVHFLGQKPYKELPQHQQAADILVIPNTAKLSVSSEFTSPLKLFTYMTSKRPIVASKVPSITHVLSESEAAFFVADNPESLRETITRILHDIKGSAVMAERAYQKSKEYTWYKRAAHIMQFVKV